MVYFIDRRRNPKDKSLGNRQRFLRRARRHLKDQVDRAVRERSITDLERGQTVDIPTDGIDEPTFHPADKGGRRTHVLPGNKEFLTGDRIPRPPAGQGQGREGSPDGEGEDAFRFTLTREEFLDLLFDGLELPDLVRRELQELSLTRPHRAGYTRDGSPASLDIGRTARLAVSRRRALGRPSRRRMSALHEELAALDAQAKVAPLSPREEEHLQALRAEIERLERKRKRVPYIDPVDVRYARRESVPVNTSAAVMICLMDVSGSMGQREKDMAKRFFMLLHLFLQRRYEKTDIVFIRHTQVASEVDEDTFFHARETGGTVVSSALREALRVISERYPSDRWNLYVAQASDGENTSGDSATCGRLLDERILPLVQYYAYVEIGRPGGHQDQRLFGRGELWDAYTAVAERRSRFAMRRVHGQEDIYPVFRDLFQARAGRTER